MLGWQLTSKNDFRECMEVQNPNNSITLSTHFWNAMGAGMEQEVT